MNQNINKGEDSSVTVLSFDTSTASLAAAIVRDGVLLDSIVSFTERNHSVRILSEIKELLSRNGLQGKDIDVVAAGQGPGSYTGVRIAVTAAKTLAWAWNKPLLGVSSLEALAFGAWKSLQSADENIDFDTETWIIPLMDARRGQVYTSRYSAGHSDKWDTIDKDGIRLIADWSERIEKEATMDSQVSSIWFVGEIAPHKVAIEQAEQSGIRLRTLTCDMDPGAVGQLAELRFRRGERDDVHSFVPNYTQLAEAEAKLLAASRGE
ncbi:tRNA (adenosine(37)-N6)-threonylcarbamoyltransferase complex dimerization subunit type 1 TsaB [Cohnella silvisoli]|uniref:tRNA (Adenosine(37)-N6)-threonylcarbamoyltransferase complex dimerization subunit type 1 TsaB n=1 Tax=Cohnella silvisoli TaxID=2873699 RepID=A0ABV1KVT2_9BACL|nr:tRNA (adenosine(37)-N6)-threonylcarbamoyltransferase complex dimerization subunit type 1 TsaB [Cohnella silvisoli]MCD9023615.1 tRNA (adenosine(37)-N6)-threonylcarbamoyltransferase complex dimerization subunit type 1 TsaB [Cohnella silvisoli]